MKGKNNQDQLTEMQQLKQENDALKLLCEQKTTENENLHKRLNAIEWMLAPKQTASNDFVPDYGDLSDLNKDGLIKKSIPKQQLQDIVSEYLDLLETSAAIYEKNGDYALGIFSSGWCRMMDAASRKLCNTDDNREALESGKWLCHDSCWKDASTKSMVEGIPVEVACNGGINMYAVPIRANNQIVGSMNFGFGSPPKAGAELKKLSEKFKIPLAELRNQSNDYIDRPRFIIDYAKQRIEKSAQYLGYLVERQMTEKSLLRTQKTVDKSPLSVFWVSPDGKFIYVNETAAKKLQYSRDELLSMHVWDVDPNYPQETREEQFCLHRKQSSRVIESEHKRADGKVFPVKINAYVLVLEDQEMEIAEVEDITEHKHAEEAMRRSESMFKKVFEILPVGLWIADKHGQLIQGNPAGVKIWGKDQKVGQDGYGIFKARRLPSGEDIAPDDWALAHSIHKGVTIVDELLEIDAFDGKKKGHTKLYRPNSRR